jgi:hypothetical protein
MEEESIEPSPEPDMYNIHKIQRFGSFWGFDFNRQRFIDNRSFLYLVVFFMGLFVGCTFYSKILGSRFGSG